MCAFSLRLTQTANSLFYRRIKSRIGAHGAITASAHKRARQVYPMLKDGREYIKQSGEEYEAKMRGRQEMSLRRKAKAQGFELVPQATSA